MYYDFRTILDVKDLYVELYPEVGKTLSDIVVKTSHGKFIYNLGIDIQICDSGCYDLYWDSPFEEGKQYRINFVDGVFLSNYKLVDNSSHDYVSGLSGHFVQTNFNGKPVEAFLTDYKSGTLESIQIIANVILRKSFNITYVNNGHGIAPNNTTIKPGNKITKPDDLTKEGYTFEGWYTNEDCTVEYDFNYPVYDDITLYAKWTANLPVNPPTGDNITCFTIIGCISFIGLLLCSIGIKKYN